ncbi:MAG: AAA family ATPase [Nitrososphaerota archaeon]
MSLESMIKRSYRTTGVDLLDSIIYGWPRRGLALIYGSQKAGKTSLAMQAASGCHRGKPRTGIRSQAASAS